MTDDVTAAGRYAIRIASASDVASLRCVIERSARALVTPHYSAAHVEAALRGAFGVDSGLVADRTYFVAVDASGAIVGCGGWSRRRTLFGGDHRVGRDESVLDPMREAARIRAFFVDPAHVRRGIGATLLARSEDAARRAGFRTFELMATRSGVPLYSRFGYAAGPPVEHDLGAGLKIEFVPMRKEPPAASATAGS